MRHHHITRVMYISMVAFFVATGLVLGIYVQVPKVQAQVPSFVPYGGRTVAYIPPTVPPFPPCPGYYLIRNANTQSLAPLFGVYLPPFSESLLYDFKNLATPNTPVLGGYNPVPFITCPATYPVFPITFQFPFYLTGTGGIPGTY